MAVNTAVEERRFSAASEPKGDGASAPVTPDPPLHPLSTNINVTKVTPTKQFTLVLCSP
jgi:hypothetical protein